MVWPSTWMHLAVFFHYSRQFALIADGDKLTNTIMIDYRENLISHSDTIRQIELVRSYEDGWINLKDLNKQWLDPCQ